MANETTLPQNTTALKTSETTSRTHQHPKLPKPSPPPQPTSTNKTTRPLQQAHHTCIPTGRFEQTVENQINERNLREVPKALSNLEMYLRTNQGFERFLLGEKIIRVDNALERMREWEVGWLRAAAAA